MINEREREENIRNTERKGWATKERRRTKDGRRHLVSRGRGVCGCPGYFFFWGGGGHINSALHYLVNDKGALDDAG